MTQTPYVALDDAAPPFDDPRHFEQYLLGDLVVDPETQRETDPERVQRIAHDFDWLRFEMPTVVRLPDGRARVIEGQHRVLALRSLAPPSTIVMSIELPIDIDAVTEATIAYDIARGRKVHTAFESWQLRVTMAHDHEVFAERALARRHLRLGRRPAPHTIAAVATVSTLVHGRRRSPDDGAALLGQTVDILGNAFPADREAAGSRWDGRLLRAIGELLARNGDMLDDQRLVGTLARRDAMTWLCGVLMGQEEPAWEQLITAIALRYNRDLPKEARIA